MSEPEQWIFISYRRDDSGDQSRSVRDAIQKEFGEKSVFFDIDSPIGSVWPDEIQRAIKHCSVVLAIIGPEWIQSSDKWGRRRLDMESDWVREELTIALSDPCKKVLPIFVGGAIVPPAEVLPEPLRELLNRQAIEIRRDFWDHDIRLVLAQLDGLRPVGQFKSEEEIGPYPIMRTEPPAEIAAAVLERILANQLSSWIKIDSSLPEDPTKTRSEIYKEFKFLRFLDVVRFMREVAPGCEIADHHPRWENIYKTLRVYLTTWGIGHRISDRDVQLARYLDDAYARFIARSVQR
jgi:pterin-4a-carbinolamine dehydratase